MKGKIVKGISGFYYVHVAETGIYECKAKGIFRNQKIKPLVGDDVEIVVLDEEKKIGNVEKNSSTYQGTDPPRSGKYRYGTRNFRGCKTGPEF